MSKPDQYTVHVELLSAFLRIYSPGKTYAGRDGFAATAVIQWIGEDTVELKGMKTEDDQKLPSAVRGLILHALRKLSVKLLRISRHSHGRHREIFVNVETNRIVK